MQRMQVRRSILAFPFATVAAPVGQIRAQAPHPTQERRTTCGRAESWPVRNRVRNRGARPTISPTGRGGSRKGDTWGNWSLTISISLITPLPTPRSWAQRMVGTASGA